MNEKNDELIGFALYLCASSIEDPAIVTYIIEWSGEKIKVTMMNKVTKETKEWFE